MNDTKAVPLDDFVDKLLNSSGEAARWALAAISLTLCATWTHFLASPVTSPRCSLRPRADPTGTASPPHTLDP
jgi:hypothetical protein